MRILIVGVAIEGGGAEQVVADLATGVADAGHEVHIAFLEGTEDRVPALQRRGVQCTRVLERREFAKLPIADFTPSCVRRFAELYHTLAPDLVHAHVPRAALWAALAKRRCAPSLPYVYTEHNVQDVYPWWIGPVYRLILPAADHVVGVSEAATRSFRDRWGWSDSQATTIWDGIDLGRATPSRGRGEVRAELGLGDTQPLILNVANLCRRKGQDVLLEAMEHVRRALPDACCVVAGSPDLEPRTAQSLREAIRRADAGACFQLLGSRDDVADLMAACDLFVLSSRQEGLPITLLESMAAGVPAVVTDVGGCAEVVREGETGHVVPAEEPEALGAAVVRVLGDAEAASRMGRAARARAAGHFTVEAMVRRHLALYQQLIKRGVQTA